MTLAIDEFIEESRKVPFADVAARFGYVSKRGPKFEWTGPCPHSGGTDGFAVSILKGKFNCRKCGHGGSDAIGLVAHREDFDLKRRDHFLEACAIVSGRPIPEGGERESDEERDARMARIAEARAAAEANAAEAADRAEAYRAREIAKARGIWLNATDIRGHGSAGDMLRRYLHLRTGYAMPEAVFETLRFAERSYWHGQDDAGRPVSIYKGPAMVAPFVDLDGTVTGCHETWIDLDCPPKYRKVMLAADGTRLVTKKMHGKKKGSLIPLCGDMSALRWLAGEGIENVLALAATEGFRGDTFYCAAGDIGNLCGPADPASAFSHPTLKKEDVRGRLRAVRCKGPAPKPDQTPDEAMQVPDHVTELILACDGDSEPVQTASDIARAIARFTRPDRLIADWWPPPGTDWAEVISKDRAERGLVA